MGVEDFKTELGHGQDFPPAGVTHRSYAFDGANDGSEQDDLSILVPDGAQWMGIEKNANAISYEVHTAAAGSVEGLDSRRDVDADSSLALLPVKPGEFINISGQSGAIGAFTLILEGGAQLPRGVGNLTLSDPGA